MPSVFAKAARHLIPLLFFCYILAYIDRVNVGFAQLAMTDERWFSKSVYSQGAGIFFWGYFLFEVPGNMILHRVGARRWMARIMVSWGLVSMGMAWCRDAAGFYALRFLLGVAEAGFFPGIVFYLSTWFPPQYRSRILAGFMTAIAVAGVVGSPLSGWLLEVSKNWTSLRPWQWLFVLEGVPSVLLGLALPFLLPDGPQDARWLTAEEKQELLAANAGVAGSAAGTWRDAFRSPAVWLLAVVYFGLMAGLYGISFWLPQLIKEQIVADKNDLWAIGGWTAIPWGIACGAMIWNARASDRTGRRRWHVAAPLLLAAAALLALTQEHLPWQLKLGLYAVLTAGVLAALSSFWVLPSQFLSGMAAAVGIALINSVGNMAGYVSPVAINWLRDRFHTPAALASLAVVFLLAAGVLARVRSPQV
jgi:MFS family permease